MLYAIIARDHPGSLERRIALRAEHRARLAALQDQGRMKLSGPLPAIDSADPGPAGYCGSLVVAEFASLEEARAWAAADPYQDGGVYASVDIQPFVQVFPA
ncbi:YciI family protein [Chromobacterium vaccinii]|uniref:YciI family protein n=1 Tax=Chromobacterium vaccinii TaxID=1108595 RepID=UPI0006181597|nr:YciI family protein [Chromobacterium vaccinii]